MDIKRSPDGHLLEIDGKYRIEAGPVRRQAIATEELLSDAATADHYKAGGIDALGKLIVLGQPMDYIDWKSPERAYYVYARGADIWQLVGAAQATEEAALAVVMAALTQQ